jgi:hypothetical protein
VIAPTRVELGEDGIPVVYLDHPPAGVLRYANRGVPASWSIVVDEDDDDKIVELAYVIDNEPVIDFPCHDLDPALIERLLWSEWIKLEAPGDELEAWLPSGGGGREDWVPRDEAEEAS